MKQCKEMQEPVERQQQAVEHQFELAQIKQEVESKRVEFQRSENSCACRTRSNK